MGCLEEVFERLPGRKAGLSDHSVSVCSMLLYSDVANVIKDNEEIDAFEVVVDDKQTAPESTQEVVNDSLDKEKHVRLVKEVGRSSDHEEKTTLARG